MQPINREGKFRATIYQYRPDASSKTEAMGMWLMCLLTESYGPGGWAPISDGVFCAEGTVWFINKFGERREEVIENLQLATGWDGTIEQLMGETQPPWKPKDIEVTIKKEVYNEVERHKIAFVNAIAEGGGAVPIGDVTRNKLKEKFRAGALKAKEQAELAAQSQEQASGLF